MEPELQSHAGILDAGVCGMAGCRMGMLILRVSSLRQTAIDISYPCCVDVLHQVTCKDIYHYSNALYRPPVAVESNKTHHRHKMKINSTKHLYKTYHKSHHMDKNERVRLRLSDIRTYRKGLSNSDKNRL